MPKNYFDERIAKSYEAKWPEIFEPAVVEAAVSFLADLAGSGAALELGVGTGRIALPLSTRGVRVHGIELSPAMVAEMRTKPGGDAIQVTIGDFATTRVDGSFELAYLVRNTITNLTTQDEQVEWPSFASRSSAKAGPPEQVNVWGIDSRAGQAICSIG